MLDAFKRVTRRFLRYGCIYGIIKKQERKSYTGVELTIVENNAYLTKGLYRNVLSGDLYVLEVKFDLGGHGLFRLVILRTFMQSFMAIC